MLTLAEKIDALLPQTQCRDCDYDDCMSYAKAIAKDNELPNKCLPGGEQTMINIANLLNISPTEYLAAIQENTKKISLPVIIEAECIGCTKCIQACPVDAIIGASKKMHTIITDACNGCELCLPPCPVDCIDLDYTTRERDDIYNMATQSRQRYNHRQQRLATQQQQEDSSYQQARLKQQSNTETINARKAAIAAAMQRAQQKTKPKTKP